MKHREFKDNIYGYLAIIGKVLSSPKRIEILDLLSQGPKSVELLAKETKMSVANTSKHLQTLLDSRMVRFRKQGNFVIYQLSSGKVIQILFSLKDVGEEQIAEINLLREKFIVRPNQLETIEMNDFITRITNNDIYLIDVRPSTEFQTGHIAGAISIPIEEIEQHIDRLPKEKEIIAYCRGAYCVYATEAVEFLQSKGFKAFRLDSGFHEWNIAQSKCVKNDITENTVSNQTHNHNH